ncbi:hypothetical protein [Fibrobacter sp. UWH4]|uniref:hypothetical protein n=1 Tax=Fibrobacter sp. UWH4 TaxID=1896210 RepID=UPI0009127DC2|nr:hypothetical protein [Fibrobacter sp. UWH4]SHL62308.1 hypothetical protein SAMN05720762_10950 [Fibrobacter sp. UWH4]
MKMSQKINIALFSSFVVTAVSGAFIWGSDFLSNQNVPWHMQSGIDEDSLSTYGENDYRLLDKRPVIAQINRSQKKQVLILVDSWGVPHDKSKLEKEFSIFNDIPHDFAIHHRMANRTKHAERVEYRRDSSDALFLFGGDSLEFGRSEYMQEIGYSRRLFFQKCSDSLMLAKLDSVMSDGAFSTIAWTTQGSRYSSEDSLMSTLKGIRNLAKEHSDVRFVVQGTHRPILCSSEYKRTFYEHWVPTVVLNP